MLLKDTDRGRAWLRQFQDQDRLVAEHMLDTLILVSREDFQSTLLASLQRTAANATAPIGCFAARKIPEDVKKDISRKAGTRAGRSPSTPDWTPPHPYFRGEEGTPPPRPASGSGSEDVCASIVFQASRNNPERILDHPTIHQMRSKRVRQLIILDDAIGSGQRIAEFIEWFTTHPTIRSWLSLGLIDVSAIVYAATTNATEQLTRRLPGVRNHPTRARKPRCVEVLRELDLRPGVWVPGTTPTMAARITSLCERYGAAVGISAPFRRGWRRSLGYLVFAHGCPNNVPGILHRGAANWSPLFNNRTVPDEILGAFQPHATTAARLTQAARIVPRLAGARTPVNKERQSRILVLSALRKVRKLERIVHATGIPPGVVKDILRSFHLDGFVAPGTNRITDLGRRELARALRVREPLEEAVLTSSIYIPKSFRGDRRDT